MPGLDLAPIQVGNDDVLIICVARLDPVIEPEGENVGLDFLPGSPGLMGDAAPTAGRRRVSHAQIGGRREEICHLVMVHPGDGLECVATFVQQAHRVALTNPDFTCEMALIERGGNGEVRLGSDAGAQANIFVFKKEP